MNDLPPKWQVISYIGVKRGQWLKCHKSTSVETSEICVYFMIKVVECSVFLASFLSEWYNNFCRKPKTRQRNSAQWILETPLPVSTSEVLLPEQHWQNAEVEMLTTASATCKVCIISLKSNHKRLYRLHNYCCINNGNL